MCGITGVFSFNKPGSDFLQLTEQAVRTLQKRGPDGNGTFTAGSVALGHSRLSIFDTSTNASQPFTDNSGRYTIVFNGEFFNFLIYRKQLAEEGIQFRSTSDTEVLLYLFIKEGIDCLNKINGFFSFAVYDKQENSLTLARDRYGVKPLYYYQDEEKFIFGSELKSILAYPIKKEIDKSALRTYFHLNYIPHPQSILQGVYKLDPGTFISIKGNVIKQEKYYSLPADTHKNISFEEAKKQLNELLSDAVKIRLEADVPVGAFLSGGIDSSVIVALASQYTSKLNTFSIGFKDEPYFDETDFANLLAKKYKTNHTVFSLTNKDLFEHIFELLNYTDEPFADSSALAVHILSQNTRKHVSVALSGDGADELFGGYNKHAALLRANQRIFSNALLKNSFRFFQHLPSSRNNKLGNKLRQLKKYSSGLNLNDKERYWRWAGFYSEQELDNLLNGSASEDKHYFECKRDLLSVIDANQFNTVLRADFNCVLEGDMLVKVDRTSMGNSLEVRSPFLDYRVVNWGFSLPPEYKINSKGRKYILKETFKELLPPELLSRGKKGFEVPLLKWFLTDLSSFIEELTEKSFIVEQGLFNPDELLKLKLQLRSSNPDDAVAKMWAIIVFQYWWKKYFKNSLDA